MTSAINPLSAVDGLSGLSGISGAGSLESIGDPTGIAAPERPNTDFGGMLAKGLETVQSAQSRADGLAVQVADGTLADPAQYTMAATEASLGLQLTMAVRNKAVDAFQEIMRMQA